jgi:hypothetical protein
MSDNRPILSYDEAIALEGLHDDLARVMHRFTALSLRQRLDAQQRKSIALDLRLLADRLDKI